MMNVVDMLTYADIQQLSRIARHYQCDCGSHSKRELIQAILAKMNRNDLLDEIVHKLEMEDLHFMNMIFFDRRNSYSLEELLAWAEGEKPRETIMKFRARGWLFNGHSQETKHLFTVPLDVKKKVRQSMAKVFRSRLQYADEPEVFRDENDLIVSDLTVFLNYLRHNEIKITAAGFMYKRCLQALLSVLQVEEQPVARSGWRFGYGRRFKQYPDRFSLLYDYCCAKRYIREGDGALALTEQGLRAATEGGDTLGDIYEYWLRLYKRPIRNIRALVYWIAALSDEWVALQSLREVLCPFIKPFCYDSPESILKERLVRMMMHLGLVRVGQHSRCGTVVRLTDRGYRLIMQSSGDGVKEEFRHGKQHDL